MAWPSTSTDEPSYCPARFMMTPASAASLTKRFAESMMREGANRKRGLSMAHLPRDDGAQVDARPAERVLVPAQADHPPRSVLVHQLDRVHALPQPIDGRRVALRLVGAEHVHDGAQAVDATTHLALVEARVRAQVQHLARHRAERRQIQMVDALGRHPGDPRVTREHVFHAVPVRLAALVERDDLVKAVKHAVERRALAARKLVSR